jgi:aspartate-semialdehyde dehydrogenase
MKLLRVGVVGATGTVGNELIELLAERRFPIQELVPIATDRSLGETVEWLGHDLPVETERDLAGLDLVFLCTPHDAALPWLERALRARARCIDLSGASAAREEIPVLDPELAPSAESLASPVLAVPSSSALALARAIRPLARAAGVTRVVATVCESASSAGRTGIDALQAETVALFSQREPDESPLGHGIAFDCLPATGPVESGGSTASETASARDLARLVPGAPAAITALRVPTFAGMGIQVCALLERALPAEEAEKLFDQAPGLRTSGLAAGPSLRDASGDADVLVGRVRSDPTSPLGVQFWLALDPVRLAASCAVRLAELR